MKSKKLSEKIIKTFKSNGFILSEPDILLDSEYIIQRSGENFKRSMLTFENEDGKLMCLRPDLTVASCIKYLEKKSSSKIYYSGQAYRRSGNKGLDFINDQLGIEILVYEPSLDGKTFNGANLINNLENFKLKSDIVISNRSSEDLLDVQEKIFTRDIFNVN